MRQQLLSILIGTVAIGAGFGMVAATAAEPSPQIPVIGTIGTTTLSPVTRARLTALTQQYIESVLSDNSDTFYALLSRDYQGITPDGKKVSAGTVYGSTQAVRQRLSGLVKSVHIVDAHATNTGFDEVVMVSGTADIIDAGGARPINATWVHKIYFVRDAAGQLLVSRDISLQRIPQNN